MSIISNFPAIDPWFTIVPNIKMVCRTASAFTSNILPGCVCLQGIIMVDQLAIEGVLYFILFAFKVLINIAHISYYPLLKVLINIVILSHNICGKRWKKRVPRFSLNLKISLFFFSGHRLISQFIFFCIHRRSSLSLSS